MEISEEKKQEILKKENAKWVSVLKQGSLVSLKLVIFANFLKFLSVILIWFGPLKVKWHHLPSKAAILYV